MPDFNLYIPSGPNRYVCSVLEEMRGLLKTTNFFTYKRNCAMLMSLIEEAQTCVNRMEAALENWDDLNKLQEKRSKLIKDCRKLKEELKQLDEEVNDKKESEENK